ncbi:hypothetical protein A2U01_0112144, partial [Trifolium medium]|nr:hypothetical protein [Trifolium medium]
MLSSCPESVKAPQVASHSSSDT